MFSKNDVMNEPKRIACPCIFIFIELLSIGSSWSSRHARPCEGVHRSMSLMNSSPLLQPCPACLVRLPWIVFVMGGKWPCSCCFVGCCLHDLFNIALSILVWLPSSFFSVHLLSVHVAHPYNSIDKTTAWKKNCILSVKFDFHMTDSLSLDVHAFANRMLTSVSVDETRLLRLVNLSSSFRELTFCVEVSLIEEVTYIYVTFSSVLRV